MLSLHRAWKPAILPSGARAGRDLPHIPEPRAFSRSYQSFAGASGARLREDAMPRSTDRLIALQFLAVAVPIAFVLLAQMAADARRAAALEQSRPLRTLANEARANYRTFTNGAADAVDTGALGRQSAEALNTTAALLARLAERGEAAALGDTPGQVADLAARVASGATLERLMALRPQIARADHETRAIDESFERRDAAVVEDAVESARVQKQEVSLALLISGVLTVVFVLATRRRPRRRACGDDRRHAGAQTAAHPVPRRTPGREHRSPGIRRRGGRRPGRRGGAHGGHRSRRHRACRGPASRGRPAAAAARRLETGRHGRRGHERAAQRRQRAEQRQRLGEPGGGQPEAIARGRAHPGRGAPRGAPGRSRELRGARRAGQGAAGVPGGAVASPERRQQ